MKFSYEVWSRCQLGQLSSEGLTGIGGSLSKMVRSDSLVLVVDSEPEFLKCEQLHRAACSPGASDTCKRQGGSQNVL